MGYFKDMYWQWEGNKDFLEVKEDLGFYKQDKEEGE